MRRDENKNQNDSLKELSAQHRNSPLCVHVGYVGPERHGALKLAGVDQDEDKHGVDHHRHPEVLQGPAPPLKVHLDKKIRKFTAFVDQRIL